LIGLKREDKEKEKKKKRIRVHSSPSCPPLLVASSPRLVFFLGRRRSGPIETDFTFEELLWPRQRVRLDNLVLGGLVRFAEVVGAVVTNRADEGALGVDGWVVEEESARGRELELVLTRKVPDESRAISDRSDRAKW
jgi:hypothetical protein